MTQQELEVVFKASDTDGSNRIDFDEFVLMMRALNRKQPGSA